MMIRRVRTGCITCRRRHIKCDEGKPTCERCRNGNFHCEGYEYPRRIAQSLSSSSSRRNASPPTAMTMELSWRQANWRQEQLPLYHHFITSTVFRLFGVDYLKFWRDQVSQMSSGIDVVYESLLAVGAAHRGSLLSSAGNNAKEVNKHKVMGFSAYGRALRLLASDISVCSETDPFPLLVALLLCTYFECFMENLKGALRHLWAAIQVLRSSEKQLSKTELANMVPVYGVILRLDFLAQKLVPYAGSSFSCFPNLAFMELPFWSRQPCEYSAMTQSDAITTERHKLMQLICGHGSEYVWGSWQPASERPKYEDLMSFYNAMLAWKASSRATFASCPDLEDIHALFIEEFYTLPIPPKPLKFTSCEAALNVVMFNACTGCTLAIIDSIDENPIPREIEIFNLIYQSMCIAAGLIDTMNGKALDAYMPSDTLDLGISIFLYHGALRSFSLDWFHWTTMALRSIGREGLSNAHASANTLDIMRNIETTSPLNVSFNSSTPIVTSPLGPLQDRVKPLLMPREDDSTFLAYFLQYDAARPEGNERLLRVIGRAAWKQDEHGNMESLEVNTYHSADARPIVLLDESGIADIFSSWRQSVKYGWHGLIV